MREITRLKALGIFVILWALIYIPGLGSIELKGEEARRALPAVAMLDDGHWLVPYLGGKPYLRKPPLVNWMIAGSFKLTGRRDEWAARLPSALCMLALGSVLIGLAGRSGWLRPSGALIAALFCISFSGVLAKARFAGAEIDGVYTALSGIAVAVWLAWWSQGRSPWLTWTVPFVFLGLASLAKGPSLHLLFFYAVVVGTLTAKRRLREFLHLPHWVGLLITAAVFAVWAVPYFRSPEAVQAVAVWKAQSLGRFFGAADGSELQGGGSVVRLAGWLSNFPRALQDLLPWVLLVPVLVRVARTEGQSIAGVADPSAWMPCIQVLAFTGGCFVVLVLVPGMLPRYLLPLSVPLGIFLAAAVEGARSEVRFLGRWHALNQAFAGVLLVAALLMPFAAGADSHADSIASALRGMDFAAATLAALCATAVAGVCVLVLVRKARDLAPAVLTVSSCALVAGAMLAYACSVVPWLRRVEDSRSLAAQIDSHVPRGGRICLLDPGYLTPIFYLRSAYAYAGTWRDVPADAGYVLVVGDSRRGAERAGWAELWSGRARRGPNIRLLGSSTAVNRGGL